MAELFFDSGYLVNLAMLAYVLGLLFRRQVILRLLVLVGTGFYIAYYYFHPAEPLWGAIYASLAIAAANLIGLILLLYNRLPIGIPAHEWPIFQALSGLEPGEFRQLMKQGKVRRADDRVTLTREGEPLDEVFFLISGDIEATKDGVAFPVPSGEFAGEVSFMLDSPASATLTMARGGVYVEWPKGSLRALFERNPKLRHAFEALIGRDMARKVASGRRSAAAPA